MSTARGSSQPRALLKAAGSVTPGRPALLPALRAPMGITTLFAALIVTVLAAVHSGDITAGRLDMRLKTAVDDLLPLTERNALLIDLVGKPLVAGAGAGLLAVVCLALGRHRLAVVAVTGLGLTGVVTTVLKPVIGRTIHEGYLAYPSGHTAAATVLALVATMLAVDVLGVGKWPGVLLILVGAGAAGATMAWAQVSLAAHYPTDTIGGFCSAMAVVPATALLTDRFAGWRRGAAARGGGVPKPALPRPDDDRRRPDVLTFAHVVVG